ncbi:MAG TPA: hypothetical protein VNS08_09905 [Ureibacillus sp.]|nr:hypothetical protein [Ureibacillus sp.]
MNNLLSKVFLLLAALSFCLLIILDFFPVIEFHKIYSFIGILLFGFLSAITDKNNSSKNKPAKQILLMWAIAPTALILLLVVLTLLGGHSESGVGIDNPVIWILYIGTIISAGLRLKKNPGEIDKA